jgi:hypothetical protein
VGQATIQDIGNNSEAGYLDDKPSTLRRFGEVMAFGGSINTSSFCTNHYSPVCVVPNASRDRVCGSRCLRTRLGDIPDQSVSADSFQGSGTGGNGTFQSFLSGLIPVDSRYFAKNSINYAIKRLKTII